jgi:hypothetical protein
MLCDHHPGNQRAYIVCVQILKGGLPAHVGPPASDTPAGVGVILCAPLCRAAGDIGRRAKGHLRELRPRPRVG